MTQSDLEWPRTAMEIVWMTQYDFRCVKSTSASPFWGPSDLDISICSDLMTSQREVSFCINKKMVEKLFVQAIFLSNLNQFSKLLPHYFDTACRRGQCELLLCCCWRNTMCTILDYVLRRELLTLLSTAFEIWENKNAIL